MLGVKVNQSLKRQFEINICWSSLWGWGRGLEKSTSLYTSENIIMDAPKLV